MMSLHREAKIVTSHLDKVRRDSKGFLEDAERVEAMEFRASLLRRILAFL